MANIVFVVLAGFGFIAIVFLLMLASQLFKMEKALADLTVLVEGTVKKRYSGE
jgi:hypothetical protein